MSEVQHPICGFVPPHVLEAIAGSTSVPEECRIACHYTLKHAGSYKDQHHQLGWKAHVRSPSTKSKEDRTTALQPVQQPLTAAGAELAVPVQRKIYDCKETQARPGTLVRSEGQERIKDRQGNNCYDGFKITHDFYSKIFGRNSIDDRGLALVGSIHYKLNSAPAGYNNAFWDGNKNQMVFGDGDHIAFDYLTDSPDVIAHELSHGFVQFTSPLEYYWQAGALNESCADVFGCMIEQWHMRQSVDDGDWNVGQTVFPVSFRGTALRTLKAGKALFRRPYLYTGGADNRGVHINSGIPNHAFYLAAKSLRGYSWEKAGKVWYKTMTSGKIPSNCDFATFAAVTVDVAGKEFIDASVENAIRDAWVKVGVLAPNVSLKALL
ncbi:uncharacterized protein A1O9_06157 [Exophiala aquamarina CBS 119918]|uniref:Uncharacterized protein n=1 Tax=Exophiala aquamarina CBS 119918 TaxID=1182545 RepID=A0A072PEG3_9EURO|nr:uncharacterized protein A1O9_06157 [Exophiala aquamarina CBS 119918]KEF58231.1 hypothetical protein A1O9_06157 [Exophiala aquamarina CBS 119918]